MKARRSPRERHQLLTEYFLNAYLIAMTVELGQQLADLERREARKRPETGMEMVAAALLRKHLE